MTDVIEGPAAERPRVTKATTVKKLLARTRGATLADIIDATGWQPHSARAFLSGIRKKGVTLVRDQRRDGATMYRIGKGKAATEVLAAADA